jgi:iron complex outermembrane receptor protein
MRKDFQGLQATIDIGASSRGDGQRQGGSFTFGQSGEKGNVMAGVDYNKFHAISSGDRNFSKDSQYFYSGSVHKIGSSRTPFGSISLPASSPLLTSQNCSAINGNGNRVTLKAGASGSTQADYRCYNPSTDAFNYQASNLIQTPQERTNAFFLGNYQISDDVTAFLQVYHNKTSAGFGIAALPFDAKSDAVTIAANNYYNPFGIAFGPGQKQLRSRFVSLGQRRSLNATTTDQVFAGLEGTLAQTWKWDFALNYGHISRSTETKGYVYYQGLKDALGPSFKDPGTGVITCGVVGAPIANCTPLNIFNTTDPQTVATLRKYAVNPLSTLTYVQKGFEANASGELFNLPAGAVQLAFGGQYRREYQRTEVDYVALAKADGTCFISQEACGSPLSGSFSVGELYGELFVPILKDVPFAKALSVTFGSRYSNYSNFGNTVNNKLSLEWRPITDLLLRGTVAEVFRAPTIGDLFTGPSGNAPQALDPCVGYSPTPGVPQTTDRACGAQTGATAIPPGGITSSGLGQTTGVVSGSVYAGYKLTPEQGRSYDWGLVYDPSWLTGFSVSLDYWRLSLNDNISTLGAQTVLTQCFQDPNSVFCPFIHRDTDGQISYINQPTVNLGRLDAQGYDVALRYKLPFTSWGVFNAGFDGTYLAKEDNDVDTTSSLDATVHLAGKYNKDYGLYPRVRARAFLNWNMGDWSAGFRTRYIGATSVGSADLRQNLSADAGCDPIGSPQFCGIEIRRGAYVVHSLNVGYKLPSTNSSIELGVDNLTDKQPPILFQNNVLNANTDPSNFDTIGRYYFARYTVKF